VNKTTALYRFYDEEHVLLYVGITTDLPWRLQGHAGDKDWWIEVTEIRVEHFGNRIEAEEAERRAIRIERPMYNVQHNQSEVQEPTVQLRARRAADFAQCRHGVWPGSPLVDGRFHQFIGFYVKMLEELAVELNQTEHAAALWHRRGGGTGKDEVEELRRLRAAWLKLFGELARTLRQDLHRAKADGSRMDGRGRR
jgi:predicted GIY-YIG superfamily endonuclease